MSSAGILRRTVSVSARNCNDHKRYRVSGRDRWFKVVKTSESYAGMVLGAHRDWTTHEAVEVPYLQAEEDRLLYVAATRARDPLSSAGGRAIRAGQRGAC